MCNSKKTISKGDTSGRDVLFLGFSLKRSWDSDRRPKKTHGYQRYGEG